MVLGVGYSVAAVAPAALGGLRDLTGSFSGAMWALVGTAAVLVPATRALEARVGRHIARRAPAPAAA